MLFDQNWRQKNPEQNTKELEETKEGSGSKVETVC